MSIKSWEFHLRTAILRFEPSDITPTGAEAAGAEEDSSTRWRFLALLELARPGVEDSDSDMTEEVLYDDHSRHNQIEKMQRSLGGNKKLSESIDIILVKLVR